MATRTTRTRTVATAAAAVAALALLASAAGTVAAAPQAGVPADDEPRAHDCGVASGSATGTRAALTTAASNASANRTGPDQVTVSVDRSLFPSGTDPTNATVALSAPGGNETYDADETSGGAFVYRVPVTDLATPARDLSTASVTVTPQVPNATGNEVTVDLRSLTFGAADAARLNDSTLIVPVEQSLGVASGDDVPVSAGPTGDGPVNPWTAHLDANGTGTLTLPLDRFSASQLLNETLRLRPQFGFETNARLDVTPRAAAVDASVERTSDGLVVRHPLLLAGEEYAVVVNTTNPPGRYVRAHSPGESKNVTLPDSLLIAEERRIAVAPAAYPTDLFTTTHTVTPPERVVNGTTLNVSGVAPSNLVAVWVRNGTTVTKVSDPSVDGSALALPTDVVGSGVESVLLQGDRLQPVRITSVTDSRPAQQNNDTDTAAPTGTSSRATQTGATTASNGTGNETSLFGTNATEAKPTMEGSALIAPLIALAFGALCFVVGYLLDQTGTGEGYGATGGLVAFFAVFGVGLGYWLGGDSVGGALLFEGAALVFALLFAGAYLAVDLATRTSSASQRSELAALLVAAVVSLVAAALVFVLAPNLSLLASGGVYSTLAAGAVVGVGSTAGGARGGGTAAGTATSRTATVTVRLVDDQADTRIRAPVEVTVAQTSGLESQTERTSDGTATFDLERGSYTVEATYGGETESTQVQVGRDDRTVDLRFSARALTVTVQDTDGRPLPDADVTVVGDDQDSETFATNADGQRSFEVPVSVDSLDASVSRRGYADESLTIPVARQRQVTVELAPVTGSLTATVTVDGQPVEGFSVTAAPERTDAVGVDERDAETDENGRARFDDLPVGEYSASVALPASLAGFVASDATVVVEANATATVDVPVAFEFELSRTQRDRIEDVRATLSDLSTASSRDTAIPGYYASVVERVLETAESIPESGYPFLVHRADPAATVDALLDASEAAAAQVDEAMRSKRNVDLFSACSNLPDADVEWRGSLAVEDVLALADRGVGEQRGRFADHLDTVDEVITDELSGLAEISPAREMWDGSRTIVRESTGVDTTELDSAAAVITAEALLDAVEALFEEDQLRKRMKQTVF